MNSENANLSLHVREVLDYLARHTSHRHAKVLSEIAGLNSPNVYASLSGRRPLPLDAVRRLADALCLDVYERGSEAMRLSVGPGRVLNFDVAYGELAELGRVLGALCEDVPSAVKKPCAAIFPGWLASMSSDMSSAAGVAGGIYGMMVVCARQNHVEENSYVVAHVSSPSLETAFEVMRNPRLLFGELGQQLDLAEPRRINADTSTWIRMRSGFQRVRDLDDLLGISGPEEQPSGLDWAELLSQVAEKGLSPRDVVRKLDLLQEASSK